MDANANGGVPNYRAVYAEHQQELNDIDALLGGNSDDKNASAQGGLRLRADGALERRRNTGPCHGPRPVRESC